MLYKEVNSTSPVRLSEVREQLGSLDIQLKTLSERVGELTARLSVVMRPTAPIPPSSETTADKALVELASELRDKRHLVETITTDVAHILDRLEL